MAKKEPIDRIIELRMKYNEDRLTKKELEELRELMRENQKLFMIYCLDKTQIMVVKKVLRDNGIPYESFMMPKEFSFKNY